MQRRVKKSEEQKGEKVELMGPRRRERKKEVSEDVLQREMFN